MRAGPLQRLKAKSTIGGPDDCWLWDGCLNSRGYGCISDGAGKVVLVHRLAYQLLVGRIPAGLVIDHVCHNRAGGCGDVCLHRRCWNPKHLEAVTSKVNLYRSPGSGPSRTHCPKGHAYDLFNTLTSSHGTRCCRACNNAATRAWRARIKAERSAA